MNPAMGSSLGGRYGDLADDMELISADEMDNGRMNECLLQSQPLAGCAEPAHLGPSVSTAWAAGLRSIGRQSLVKAGQGVKPLDCEPTQS
jgi:hypothetical protein